MMSTRMLRRGGAVGVRWATRCASSHEAQERAVVSDVESAVVSRDATSVPRPLPMLRIVDMEGKPLSSDAEVHAGGRAVATQIYATMVKLQALDEVYYQAQRQGRISFYLQSLGEEACTVASAAALRPDDEIFAQYREHGALMWRGFPLEEFANQCFGNDLSPDKGRTMPIHYGSKKLHYHTISSPLATQIPHAVGAALALKDTERVAVTYFGDGAASEGDFYAAVNFAATLRAPVLFICRNNGWAISTPTSEQFVGDGVGSRACALGVDALRVDGNDALAVRSGVAEMRRRVAEGQRPALVELMTYRTAHHSTSDDSTKYRPLEEIRQENAQNNPLDRMRNFLTAKGWWDQAQEAEARDKHRTAARASLVKAESLPRPPVSTLFDDVYDTSTQHLDRQRIQLDHFTQSQQLKQHDAIHTQDDNLTCY